VTDLLRIVFMNSCVKIVMLFIERVIYKFNYPFIPSLCVMGLSRLEKCIDCWSLWRVVELQGFVLFSLLV